MINIGIDIDGTLTVPDFWVKPMNKHFNHQYTPSSCEEYDWLKVFNIGREEFEHFYRNHGNEMHFNADIRPSVVATIQKWANTYKLYYLTARQTWLTETTSAWLNKYQLPGEVFVLGTHNKLPKALELNCAIFIEDNYEVACQLAAGGIHVVLLDCAYNRKPLPDASITRVSNWDEVAIEVEKLTLHLEGQGTDEA